MSPKGIVWSVCIVLGLLVAMSVATAESAPKKPTGTIVVTGYGFKNGDGQAVVGVYRRGANWLNLAKAFKRYQVPIKNGRIMVLVKNLPFDEYGITVLHDKNKNGRMDMRWLPFPKPREGGGISNNWVRRGKPKYEKAKFDFARGLMSVRIKVVY